MERRLRPKAITIARHCPTRATTSRRRGRRATPAGPGPGEGNQEWVRSKADTQTNIRTTVRTTVLPVAPMPKPSRHAAPGSTKPGAWPSWMTCTGAVREKSDQGHLRPRRQGRAGRPSEVPGAGGGRPLEAGCTAVQRRNCRQGDGTGVAEGRSEAGGGPPSACRGWSGGTTNTRDEAPFPVLRLLPALPGPRRGDTPALFVGVATGVFVDFTGDEASAAACWQRTMWG